MLACVTFPLIFVGGLVTTYNAGMAVPDWPSTYGYNLFLYPWQTWLFGPWDLFIEHGHRLLGALAGMVTIALVVAIFACDQRRWLRWLAVAALVAVIAQGSLGGARVLLNERQLAMLHGCLGPAFFALVVAIAVFTSRVWRDASVSAAATAGGRVLPAGGNALRRFSLATVLFSYLQILLGAQLRHVPLDASPGSFRALVVFHVLMALVVAGHALLLATVVCIFQFTESALVRPALLLAVLVIVQLGLGVGTWIVNYSWPNIDEAIPAAAGYTIVAEGALQTNVVTAHVALGSLILAVATQLAVRVMRLMRSANTTPAVATVEGAAA